MYSKNSHRKRTVRFLRHKYSQKRLLLLLIALQTSYRFSLLVKSYAAHDFNAYEQSALLLFLEFLQKHFKLHSNKPAHTFEKTIPTGNKVIYSLRYFSQSWRDGYNCSLLYMNLYISLLLQSALIMMLKLKLTQCMCM